MEQKTEVSRFFFFFFLEQKEIMSKMFPRKFIETTKMVFF